MRSYNQRERKGAGFQKGPRIVSPLLPLNDAPASWIDFSQ